MEALKQGRGDPERVRVAGCQGVGTCRFPPDPPVSGQGAAPDSAPVRQPREHPLTDSCPVIRVGTDHPSLSAPCRRRPSTCTLKRKEVRRRRSRPARGSRSPQAQPAAAPTGRPALRRPRIPATGCLLTASSTCPHRRAACSLWSAVYIKFSSPGRLTWRSTCFSSHKAHSRVMSADSRPQTAIHHLEQAMLLTCALQCC